MIYQNVTITEKVLLHSTIMVVMEKPPAALLVVPPKDGETAYKWERKRLYIDGWDNIDVSPYACLLYVDEARQYRYTVEGRSVVFNVLCELKYNLDMFVEWKDLKFEEIICIGQGSFGTVYKGKLRDKKVALKKIKIPQSMDHSTMVSSSRELAALRYDIS